MPQQPFVGNQLAAAQAAAAQRPTYVYQPAPPPYHGYVPAQYGAVPPQYLPQPPAAAQPAARPVVRVARKRVVRKPVARSVARKVARKKWVKRPVAKRSYTVAKNVNQARAPRASIQKASRRSNQQGRVVIVRSGETLYAIARRHRVNIIQLKAANNLKGSNVSVGQRLFIPGVGSHFRAKPAPVAPSTSRLGLTVAQFQRGSSR